MGVVEKLSSKTVGINCCLSCSIARQYPTQEVQGFLFGIGQPQANDWVHRLTKILNQALGEEQQLPERNPRKLEQVLAECAEERVHH